MQGLAGTIPKSITVVHQVKFSHKCNILDDLKIFVNVEPCTEWHGLVANLNFFRTTCAKSDHVL